jgi:CRP-like cAMP-binding protein
MRGPGGCEFIRDQPRLFNTGDQASSMYVVISGQVNVSRLGPNGEEFVVDVFLPGDTLGDLSIFEDGLVRMVDCLAAERTVCLAIGRQPLLAFLERNHRIMARVLAALARRVRDRDLLMSETSFRAARPAGSMAGRGGRLGGAAGLQLRKKEK